MGARWNSAGTEVIYTVENRSLAMAEIAVHFTLATLPSDFYMLTIYIPESMSIRSVQMSGLPRCWNVFPHIEATKAIGDTFIRSNTHCLLRVPSAVSQGDHNILINPFHPEFRDIRIISSDKFPFDERIFK